MFKFAKNNNNKILRYISNTTGTVLEKGEKKEVERVLTAVDKVSILILICAQTDKHISAQLNCTHLDDGLGEIHALEDHCVVWVAQRVPRSGVLQPHQRNDVTRPGAFY